MSKKKSLSPTASVATCLDFAARVLSSKATVQDVCTKSVLAPMVVEAHRYGQQVMKYLEPGAPADARKLLRLLQSKQNAMLYRDSPLANLNVADLTWDFEGSVADTLEMELKELQQRATTNTTDTCVVFTTSTLVSSGGHAVLWFPKESYARDEDSTPIKSKRQQFLLYVCPGRVKVVKSVGDLIKKMYDELPFLRENDATYSVWAVVMGSRVSNQLEDVPLKMESRTPSKDDGQNPIESVVECSKSPTPTATNEENQQRPEKLSAEVNNRDRAEFVNNNQQRPETSPAEPNNKDRAELVKNNKHRPEPSSVVPNNQDRAESVTADDVDQDDSPPVSPRFSVYHDATDDKRYFATSASIFSFDKKSLSDVRTKEGGEECEGVKETERRDNANIVEGEGSIPVDNQYPELRPNRAIVSASLAKFSFRDAAAAGMDHDFGLGVRLKGKFAWQSCDGKVLRRSVRSQQTPKLVESEPNEPLDSVLDEDSSDSDDDHAEFQNAIAENTVTDEEEDNRGELENESKVFRFDGLQEQRRSTELLSHQEVNKITTPTVESAPPLSMLRFERESNAHKVVTCQVSVNASSPSLMKESLTFASADAPCQSADGVDCCHNDTMEPLTENLPASVQGEVPVVYVDEMEPLGQLDLAVESVTPALKLKPAPVNYKDKLGAQIWWELEYTARKLEREEILERQQQAGHRQGGNPVEGRCRIESRKAGGLNRPQRKEPKGWSKSAGAVSRMEPSIVSETYACGDQQDLLPGSITMVACEPPEEQKVVEQVPVSSTPEPVREVPVYQLTEPPSRQSSEMPCKVLSPFATSKNNGESSCFSSRSVVNDSKIQVHSSRTSGGKLVSNIPPPTTTSMTAVNETQKLETLNVEQPNQVDHPATLTVKSDERVERSSQGRTHSLKASSSPVNPHDPETINPNNQEEDDDEKLAQVMWGSTRTSYLKYDQDRTEEEELPATEIVPALPFSARGRVPIRARSTSSRAVIPATDALPDTIRDDTRTPRDQLKPQNPVTSPQAAPATPKPPVATFIVGEDNSPHTAIASFGSRQDRLTELRQKKLRKLQETRELSIQQQKEKQQVRQPLSFASFVYSKASNRQLIQNALEYTLLAGGSMEKERTLALLALEQSTCDNFIVLLKSAKELQFRALYENHVDRDCATRIFSVLPSSSARAPLKIGSSELISQFFKYSSGKKQFLPVSTRSLTVKTDACALADHQLFKNKPKSALARLLY